MKKIKVVKGTIVLKDRSASIGNVVEVADDEAARLVKKGVAEHVSASEKKSKLEA